MAISQLSVNEALIERVSSFKTGDRISVRCGVCDKLMDREKRSLQKAIKKHGDYVCASCIMCSMGDVLKNRVERLKLDGEWQNKLSEGVRRAHRDGKFSHKSEFMKRKWHENYDYMKSTIKKVDSTVLSNALKKHFESDKARAVASEASKKLWQDDAYKIKRSIALHASITQEVRQKLSESSRRLWQDDEYRAKIIKSRIVSRGSNCYDSVLERLASEYITSCGFEVKNQFVHGPWSFDILVEGTNDIIEINGSYYHSRPDISVRDRQKNTYFSRHMSAEHKLHYISECDFYAIGKMQRVIDSILNIKHETIEFELSDVQIRTSQGDETKDFLSKYHYLAKYKCGIHFGAYLGSELIGVVVFSPVTRKETATRLGVDTKSILELSRFCIHPNRHKNNFASWFIARAVDKIKQLKQSSIIVTFADTSLGHNGSIYKASGWEFDGEVKATYQYIDQGGNYYHKKSVWDQASRLSMTESEYVHENNLIKISGQKLLRFIKRIK